MPSVSASVTTPDGTCPITLHTPDGGGPWPGVVMYVDAGGVRDTMHEMAAHLADKGYAVLLPDVYYRHGDWKPFDMRTAFADQEERTRLMGMVGSLTPDLIASDAGAFLDFLEQRPEVTGSRFGIFGYCMGGRASVIVAGREPDRVAAAGSFHGGGLVTDDPNSPHLLADRMKATIYVAGAENDGSFTTEHAETLDKALTAAGVEHMVEFYPAGHGFAVPDNPPYDEAAADRHWAALERLFGASLPYPGRPAVGRAAEVRDDVRVDNEVSTTQDAGGVGSRMNPVLARSWLLVNGAQYERFTPAVASRADIVVLDIEDAVAPKDKAAARDNVIRWLGEGHGDWVRVNGFGSQWWQDDLDMLSGTSVGGVMLAMVESVDHVTETAKRLAGVPIVALVETARGLERIAEIAAAKGTFRLAFGIGDFRRDTGFGDNPMTLAYARSRFTIAAKAAHLPSAIDGPTVGTSALKLSEATAVSTEFGMTGKICLTPDQCATVNEGLSPSVEEIAWAKEFFTEFERDGGEIRNGSDLPRIARANKILHLARAYGIEPSEFDDVDDAVHIPAPSDTYHY